MSQTGTNRDELEVGIKVEINPQQDRTRKKLVVGIIKEILTGSSHHPHGILVSLESGEIGRVKKIIDSSLISEGSVLPPTDQKTVHSPPDLHALIAEGENHFVEFKSSILWSIRLSDQHIKESLSPDVKRYGRDASKFIIAKAITGFLNSEGGNLLIGIKENKSAKQDEVIGIESEFIKLQDQCVDGYRRMIIDQIIKLYLPIRVFHHFNNYLQIHIEQIEGKSVCLIQIQKSDQQVFITHNKNESFFVRIDASTRELRGSDIVNYCMKRFV